jgi:hypothetical protein
VILKVTETLEKKVEDKKNNNKKKNPKNWFQHYSVKNTSQFLHLFFKKRKSF